MWCGPSKTRLCFCQAEFIFSAVLILIGGYYVVCLADNLLAAGVSDVSVESNGSYTQRWG